MKQWKKTEHLNPTGGLSFCVTDANGDFVAKNLTDETASLIAAAPELLEALEKITNAVQNGNAYEPITKFVDIAKLAITKATV